MYYLDKYLTDLKTGLFYVEKLIKESPDVNAETVQEARAVIKIFEANIKTTQKDYDDAFQEYKKTI